MTAGEGDDDGGGAIFEMERQIFEIRTIKTIRQIFEIRNENPAAKRAARGEGGGAVADRWRRQLRGQQEARGGGRS
ncbi:hypothetical protein U1Q18_018693 [Sarracenia purpurea var. burkii]